MARLAVLLASSALIASLGLVVVDRLFLPERFAIHEVVVLGAAPNVDPAAVLVAVRNLGPRSWFSVDLDEVETAVAAVPWVYQADVRRKWPGKLLVTVAQAEPAARWNGKSWLNSAGEPLSMPSGYRNGDLPDLHGPLGTQDELISAYHDAAAIFRSPGSRIVAMRRSVRGVWSMRIDPSSTTSINHIEVMIGKSEFAERIERIAAVLRNGLGPDLKRITHIDLRYPNGFAARVAGKDGNEPSMARSQIMRNERDTG